MPEYAKKLAELLDEAVEVEMTGLKKVGVAFSGGLDSSIIAYLCSKHTDVMLYVAGLEGAYDIKMAEKTSGILGLPLKKIILDEKKIRKAAVEMESILATSNLVLLGFEMPLYFVCKKMKEKTMVCGQGADELFGGYKKYTLLSGLKLKNELEKDLNKLMSFGVSNEYGIGKYFKKEIKMPFLNKNVVDFVRLLPVSLKVRNTERKILLRAAARELGLYEIAELKKKAAQYGSGIMNVLKKCF